MNNTIELSQEKELAINEIPVESFKEFNVLQIQKFQEILGILNRYYNTINDNKKSETQKNRDRIEKENSENVILRVRKFGNYEYLIDAEIKNVLRDTWIHLDGIAEERNLLKDRGITNHPVFNIVSLGDIFDM